MATSYFYKLKISYDGHGFYGWQIQSETNQTIQGQLNDAFKRATGISNFKTIGSGRTDAEVHAHEQVVLLECDKKLPDQVFLKGVNQQLPSNIFIWDVSVVDKDFHPIHSAKSKTYQYLISTSNLRPFFGHRALYYQVPVNLDLKRKGLHTFIGRYDFCNYFCVGTEVSSTEREIFDASIQEAKSFSFGPSLLSGSFYLIEFKGSGFLKQQVRLMVGAILALNEGKISLNDLEESLQRPISRHLSPVAPGHGLYLKTVEY